VKPNITRDEVFVESETRRTWRSHSFDTPVFFYDRTVTVLRESH
jgi:hypothetical protein